MRDARSLSSAVAGVVIVSVLALSSGIAGAHDTRFNGKVTIKTNPQFHGQVTSERTACENQRKVLIFREQSGPDGLFTTTRTDDDGLWEYLVSQLTGDFYSKIKRTNVGSGGHKHICKGDRSRSVHVQAPPP
jgi:hypothetical protein